MDAEGNVLTEIWFNGVTPALSIVTELEVETYRANPFDFIFADPRHATLPIRYRDEDEVFLGIYTRPDTAGEGGVTELAAGVLERVEGRTLDFLTELCRHLYATVKSVERENGPAQSPQQTLELMTGACRDHAVLFIEICRLQGLATRFVSGYVAEEDVRQTTLHAWGEVFLPGGGWRAFDPSIGLAVNDRYVALAASRTPSRAAPVSGSFRGTGATSTIKTGITIDFE
jgi:transglutaminase-like putative cysteine protease